MSQIEKFIEEVKGDEELKKKFDALIMKNDMAGIISLLAESGFSITEEDLNIQITEEKQEPRQLSEEQLADVSGGVTYNRYDPSVCSKFRGVEYNCVGFLELNFCDHYSVRRVIVNLHGYSVNVRKFSCAMGYYDYYEGQL